MPTQDLPEYIEVDVAEMEVGDIVHVSDLALPEGVELTSSIDVDTPVVLIHAGYSDAEPEEGEEGEEGAEGEPEA